ncbi:MAG: hypothetical protein QOF02_493 [Blastocatellia bacterium]|jgi:hypothetical protein|nr:hypothetical protein [Blastocatellia bacterium]
MEPQAGGIIINSATSQLDRWLRALDAEYAQADGRSFTELLNFAIKFARLINFYDLKNEIDGDWVEFFLTDPTMILASLEGSDLSGIESAFLSLERLTKEPQPFEQKFQRLREIFELILALARLLDLWLKSLSLSTEDETTRLLRQAIVAEIIGGLNDQLRLLISYDWGAGLPDALGQVIGLNYEGFSPVWNLDNICADGSIYKGRTNSRKINHALAPLSQIFYAFFYAISDLTLFAAANLSATLADHNHKPHIALYIAFVRLFKTAQDTLNAFSDRYINFYYRDILRERNRAAIPDNVYLTFTLADGVESGRADVPLQTLFSAGQDASGADIVYASDKSLLVTAALIAKLNTLRVVRGALLPDSLSNASPESLASPPPDAFVTQRIFTSKITPGATDGAVEASAPQGWATFGETAVGTKGVEVTTLASLGFAIASSSLLLTGGTRTVTINVNYSSAFKEQTLDPLLRQLAHATGLTPDTIFRNVLEASFALYVSTAAGWFPVQTYRACPPFVTSAGEPVFKLLFQLPPTLPPVVAYDPASAAAKDEAAAALVSQDPEVNASNPSAMLPTLKAYLRQSSVSMTGSKGTANVYPLSLLDRMPVTSFQIQADVANLAPLAVANTDGDVDTKTPFTVFGGLPVVGSYLLIRHSELFVKTIERLQVGISWFNLPQTDDGFKGYYKDYVIGLDGKPDCNLFNNRVFHGGFSIQNPGTWSLSNCYQSPYVPPQDVDVLLFRTEPTCAETLAAARLCVQSNFDNLRIFPCAPPPYYDPATGAVKLSLTGPPYAFGNDLFAPNVLYAAMEALPDSQLCQQRSYTECEPLLVASQCIATCLQRLGGSPPPDGSTPVSDCLRCLYALFMSCFKQCLNESRELPVKEGLSQINSLMESLASLPVAMWSQTINQCQADFSKLFGVETPPCLVNCLQRCLAILNAMQCVWTCQWGSPPASLAACLEQCKTNLDAAYVVCLKSSLEECLSLKKELKYPNTPYLPQATGLTVNYSAACAIPTTGTAGAVDLLFHLLPFGGYRKLEPALGRVTPWLLPDFRAQGNLYVGFTGLVTPQTLTLLFQMAAGSDPDREIGPLQVFWEYLSNNQWQPLPQAKIQRDTTNGLQNTGIITLNLPASDATHNTVLSSDYQWLRASVTEQASMYPDTLNIYPHAVLATWQGNGAGEYLGKPLPPHTITSSVNNLPGIDTIDQPIESFGGSPPETDRAFKVRVGERLRHKERAILAWDYERLVLERFPTIWKTQTLPARTLQKGDAQGNVMVVVVPGPDSIGVADATVPQATADMLSQIHAYLKSYMSPFVQLHVVNPNYVRIKVTTVIQFRDTDDPGAAIERLNKDLVGYLSPWFYDAARAAKAGRYVSEDDISDFVQTRPYVAAMISIGYDYDPPRESFDWYFLTSARQHQILDATTADNANQRSVY